MKVLLFSTVLIGLLCATSTAEKQAPGLVDIYGTKVGVIFEMGKQIFDIAQGKVDETLEEISNKLDDKWVTERFSENVKDSRGVADNIMARFVEAIDNVWEMNKIIQAEKTAVRQLKNLVEVTYKTLHEISNASSASPKDKEEIAKKLKMSQQQTNEYLNPLYKLILDIL